jgi:F1F0 ATPase subunit 2
VIPALALPAALAAGAGIGVVHFGGLWWTVRRAAGARRPATWFLLSFVVRTALTLSVLVLVAGGHWERMAAALVGFVAFRHVVGSRVLRSAAGRTRPTGRTP